MKKFIFFLKWHPGPPPDPQKHVRKQNTKPYRHQSKFW
jgi:hypothetical protein